MRWDVLRNPKMVHKQSTAKDDRPVMVLPETVLNGISAIERAISKQTEWFKTWQEQVVVKHDISAFSVSGLSDVPLGAWYQSDASLAFRNNPSFQALGESLNDMVAQVRGFLAVRADGEPHPVDDYTHFMNTLLDINGLVQQLQNDSWRGLTKMDPLTGMRNRHDMMVDLDNERERARRSHLPCSLAMVDLDHFKKINDTYGHVVGDMVLRHVSRMFSAQLRPYDMVYRYGGEEFLLCLPNTELNTAVSVLDRLRQKIEKTEMAYGPAGEVLSITASFGVAEIDTVEHITKTIERADQVLYDVKKGGRNVVKAWHAEKAS
jgi:diguanylate cyclase (GGDEF)-like protein